MTKQGDNELIIPGQSPVKVNLGHLSPLDSHWQQMTTGKGGSPSFTVLEPQAGTPIEPLDLFSSVGMDTQGEELTGL